MTFDDGQRDPAFKQRAIVIDQIEEQHPIDPALQAVPIHRERQLIRLPDFPVEFGFGENMLAIQRFQQAHAPAANQLEGVKTGQPLDAGGDPSALKALPK